MTCLIHYELPLQSHLDTRARPDANHLVSPSKEVHKKATHKVYITFLFVNSKLTIYTSHYQLHNPRQTFPQPSIIRYNNLVQYARNSKLSGQTNLPSQIEICDITRRVWTHRTIEKGVRRRGSIWVWPKDLTCPCQLFYCWLATCETTQQYRQLLCSAPSLEMMT